MTVVLLCVATGRLHAQENRLAPVPSASLAAPSASDDSENDDTPTDVLSPTEWQRVDSAIERALTFLAAQQQPDGSFPSLSHAQPAVTSLCVLGFMAHGHLPGEGRFGAGLERATNFIISCQKRNGLVTLEGFNGPYISRNLGHHQGVAGAYNHAISSLTLSEMYGMSTGKKSKTIQNAIPKAVEATLTMQRWPKTFDYDRGGWRYITEYDRTDSDLSVTGWQLMFLRSARNAGFHVPTEAIDNAVGYIRRTFDQELGTFHYRIKRGDGRSRAMTGAGILALGHAGFHKSAEAQRAGQILLQYSFDDYNSTEPFPSRDRYHYSLFNCCQGMYQLGSPYWEEFFPRTVNAVLQGQRPNGSWDAEGFHRDRRYGNSYTTALVVLALGAPNQFLPVFQR